MKKKMLEIEKDGVVRAYLMPEWLHEIATKFYMDTSFRLPFEVPTIENLTEYVNMNPKYKEKVTSKTISFAYSVHSSFVLPHTLQINLELVITFS
jgi:hypothetical protein